MMEIKARGGTGGTNSVFAINESGSTPVEVSVFVVVLEWVGFESRRESFFCVVLEWVGFEPRRNSCFFVVVFLTGWVGVFVAV